ncbi:MAG: 1-deoxy-D-xylulose-5-phosphate synthase [Thermoflexaceae bacterium]|nr:1-deoxy-D-xylulose-5-phosphate synthase [Thermoflexaceae bacterium]
MILDNINMPGDIKKVDPSQYDELADEIRQFLIEKISKTGGHLASNLGVVELTMAMHLVFNLPQDKIIWDVGHQSYTHKILTGRKTGFDELRKFGGMSGFPKRRESDYDAFDTGHSSTSISAGLGYVHARDLNHEDYSVVSVIGDGALTGGMALEALNNASNLKTNFIIVLNDNNMSISKNVGAISNMLNEIRTDEKYNDIKENVKEHLSQIPGVGDTVIRKIKKTKSNIKHFFIPGMNYEDMGITYIGPIDGHDINKLMKAFKIAKKVKHGVLVHVITQKGKGYKYAEKNPGNYHGVNPFNVKTGKDINKSTCKTFTRAFSEKLMELSKNDDKIVTISAAMPDGTGLSDFAKVYPERFFDVGIAEEHAVTFAAGLAAGGMKPVVAIYSSFLQRAYDQILHDVCIQKLPVVFAIDRSGLVGSDGETHQGIFDLSYLGCIPNMTVMAPKNGEELKKMLAFAINLSCPAAIRYPRGSCELCSNECVAPVVYGKSELLRPKSQTVLLAVGNMVETALAISDELAKDGIPVSVVNARFVKPLDTEMLDEIMKNHQLIVTLEENVRNGGYGDSVLRYLNDKKYNGKIMNIALPDDYVEHGSVEILRKATGIDKETIIHKICQELNDMKE